MRAPPPTDVEDRVVALAIADGWGVQVRSLQYLPVGGGGYHWHAIDTTGRSLFTTVDDLDTKDWLGDDRDAVERGLIAALDTSRRLRHDANLGFVVAPLVSDAGRPAMRLGDRYAVSVYPYLHGRSHLFSLQSDPARRDRTLGMLIALHTAEPPVGVPNHERPHISGRADLEAFLRDPADPWNEGPFGERARALFAPHADQLRGRLDRFDRAAERAPSVTRRRLAISQILEPWRSTANDGISTISPTWSSGSVGPTSATRITTDGSGDSLRYSAPIRQRAPNLLTRVSRACRAGTRPPAARSPRPLLRSRCRARCAGP